MGLMRPDPIETNGDTSLQGVTRALIRESVRGGPVEALLIVPPFFSLYQTPLAPALLQAVARQAGHEVRVLHANLIFARWLGVEAYEAISRLANRTLLGEEVFAESAFGFSRSGERIERIRERFESAVRKAERRLEWPSYLRALDLAVSWSEEVGGEIAAAGVPVVGCSSMFEQTAASIALLASIKRHAPGTMTLLGGANCEGEMAEGTASLSPVIDFLFSGESEGEFVAFLAGRGASERPPGRIVHGTPARDLDALPAPDHRQYLEQLDRIFPAEDALIDRNQVWLSYESSRGCWWGQKHHCTFCGLNGLGLGYREKSAERVAADLRSLAGASGPGQVRVAMTDNIMPHGFLRTLLPRLEREPTGATLFYEVKANLSLLDLARLKRGGVDLIQPGIEALSRVALDRMDKGTTPAQNIALLRYALAADLIVSWNLLVDFPGETEEELVQTLELIPSLVHLQPPLGVGRLSLDRFSPYFDRPQEYGITGVRPLSCYAEVLPQTAVLPEAAYFFQGDYESASRRRPELVESLEDAVRQWRQRWPPASTKRPMLHLHAGEDGRRHVLIDTRELPGLAPMEPINASQALAAIAPRKSDDEGALRWALDRRAVLLIDGKPVSLVTSDPATLMRLEGTALSNAPPDDGRREKIVR